MKAAKHTVATLLALLSTSALAQTIPTAQDTAPATPQRPKWEAGLAAIALSVPDYPAADSTRQVILPAPYFVYHGKVLRSDDEDGSRLRQRLTPNIEIDFSGGGALSSDSSGSDARDGMPDLDYLLEAGPNLRLSFDGPQPHSKFIVNVPARGIVSIGSGLGWQGVVFEPELAFQSALSFNRRLSWRVSTDATFSTRALQRYFYEVAPQYATDTRPAYHASAGYLGASLDGRAAYKFAPRLRGFVSLSYLNHAGAANEDSPLYRSNHGYIIALGVSWTFLKSSQKAEE